MKAYSSGDRILIIQGKFFTMLQDHISETVCNIFLNFDD